MESDQSWSIFRTWAAVFRHNDELSAPSRILDEICSVVARAAKCEALSLEAVQTTNGTEKPSNENELYCNSNNVHKGTDKQHVAGDEVDSFKCPSSANIVLNASDTPLAVAFKGHSEPPLPVIVLDPYVGYLASILTGDMHIKSIFDHMLCDLKKRMENYGLKLTVARPSEPSFWISCTVAKHALQIHEKLKQEKVCSESLPSVNESAAHLPTTNILPDNSVDRGDADILSQVLKKQFWQYGKVSNLNFILAEHPQYFQDHTSTFDAVFRHEGPLPTTTRYFVALMAACSYKCEYLVRDITSKFLHIGGDPSWLTGAAPEHLCQLARLNSILAHQPWRVSAEIIASLTTRLLNAAGRRRSSWLMSNLVHAIVILCFTHMSAAISASLGVQLDADMLTAQDVINGIGKESKNTKVHVAGAATINKSELREAPSDGICSDSDVERRNTSVGSTNIHLLTAAAPKAASPSSSKSMECKGGGRLKDILVNSGLVDQLRSKEVSTSDRLEAFEEAVHVTAFESADSDTEQNRINSSVNDQSSKHQSKNSNGGALQRQKSGMMNDLATTESRQMLDIGDSKIAARTGSSTLRQGFARMYERIVCGNSDGLNLIRGAADFFRSKDHDGRKFKVLRVQEFSWEDHCFAFLQRYLPDVADPLEEQFTTIYDLTYGTLGNMEDVDTEPFRLAVWFYAQSLLGIRNDDYDYRVVNVCLSRPIKSFVRKVVFYPNSITAADVHQCSSELLDSEKCHVVLLAANARAQAALMYAIRAVIRHISS